MKTIKSLLIIIGILSTIVTLIACRNMKHQYEWNILMTGTRLHPVEVYQGSFIFEKGGERYFRSLGGGDCV